MKATFLTACTAASLIAIAAALVSGCSQQGAGPSDSPAKVSEAAHGGWWCAEHGIPEEECSMCNAKVAEELKAKGDWCDKHNRAESQCFLCDPSRADKFAALYEAKFGKKPPKPEAGGETDEHGNE